MISKNSIHAYLELCKPRIVTLILVTTALGYYLGGQGIKNIYVFIVTLFGSALVCAGSAALNHYLERDSDALMKRTKNRPLPQGIVSSNNAMIFGILLVLSGVLLICLEVNLVTAFLSLLTAFLYVLVYTPMKKVSWLNTTIGAIPGAIPPMGGWTAATGEVEIGAWILFLILFVWQHPHFYSIAWLFKDDYKRAGFKMLSLNDPTGKKIFFHTVVYALILIPVSILPFLFGISGVKYLFGSFILGAGLFFYSRNLQTKATNHAAHQLLKASVLYLPALLILIVIDHSF